jgi:hypothetical protein
MNLEEMVDSYHEYLQRRHPEKSCQFAQSRRVSPESAMAEAITFGFLQYFHLDPEVNESPAKGGADFVCIGSHLSPALRRMAEPSPENRFLVEASSLDPESVTQRTNIPNEFPEPFSGGAFGPLTQAVCNTVKDKDRQLAKCGMPAIVAIASAHQGIAALFNEAAAEWCLVSDPQITTPLSDPEVGLQTTNLRNSLFFRPGPDRKSIVPCRQNISAILLIAVYGEHSECYGILHPEPAFPLNIRFFPKLPFIRVRPWPIADGSISTEWVLTAPDGLNVCHLPIE